MNITIKYTADEAYFREFYEQWLERSKWKKWEPLLSLLLIILGLVYYCLNKHPDIWFLPLIVAMVGFFELGKYFYDKQQWLKARFASRVFNQQLQLTFSEEKITHQGPYTEGEFLWADLQGIKQTSKGLFLIPENGVSIYLSATAFPSVDALAWIKNTYASVKAN